MEDRLFGHQIAQATKRYGITLSHEDMKTLVRMIKDGTNATCLFKKLPHRDRSFEGRRHDDGRDCRQLWRVKYRDQDFLLVFRTTVNEIVTFLPKDQEFDSSGHQINNVWGR